MKQKIMEFIAANPVCTLASSDGDQPRVRAFLTNIIDGELYFTTSTAKSVGEQLRHNAKIELCYHNADFSKMLRITAVAQPLDDRKIKQHLIDTRDYLSRFKAGDPEFVLFRPADAVGHFWTLSDNLNEKAIEKITL
jgi:uncharacterized pyridoxamine 5'-phosphate oxidase family protein